MNAESMQFATRRPLKSCWFFAALLASSLVLTPIGACATDLRGRIDGVSQNGRFAAPRSGVLVTLRSASGNEVARAVSDGYGFYYFRNVAPGSYVLSSGQTRIALTVQPRGSQDAPVLQWRN